MPSQRTPYAGSASTSRPAAGLALRPTNRLAPEAISGAGQEGAYLVHAAVAWNVHNFSITPVAGGPLRPAVDVTAASVGDGSWGDAGSRWFRPIDPTASELNESKGADPQERSPSGGLAHQEKSPSGEILKYPWHLGL